MGFAIPTQIVRPTVEKLIQFGKVTHGYMGIGISDVTPENSRFFHMDRAIGAVVTQVEPASPGAKAGLKVGDVITQIDGEEVTDAGGLQVAVGGQNPGTTIHLQVMRDGKSVTTPVTLEAMGSRDKSGNETSDAGQGKPRWGIGLGDITPDVRQQLQAPDNLHGGVVVGTTGQPRGQRRVAAGRRDPRGRSQTGAERRGGPESAGQRAPQGQDAMVLVWSNGGSTFRVLHPTEPGQSDSGS